MKKTTLTIFSFLLFASFISAQIRPLPFIMDMVHNNSGDDFLRLGAFRPIEKGYFFKAGNTLCQRYIWNLALMNKIAFCIKKNDYPIFNPIFVNHYNI